MSAGDAAYRFWSELRDLYQAAGKPTLERLVRLGMEQHPPISVSDSTINGWLNGKAIPTGKKNERYLMVMVAFLQARVNTEVQRESLSPGEWGKLLRIAHTERTAAKKVGRPHRAAPSASPRDAHERWRAVPDEKADTETPADADVFTRHGDELAVHLPEVLIGRDTEFARLIGLVKAVAAGRGSAVLVEGEPGIGKSTLVRAALAEATRLGCHVFWGTGDELGQMLPLQPMLDALRVREPSRNPRRSYIARLLRGEETANSAIDGSTVLAEQLLALIADQCAAKPTVLVIDDLQWADPATIAVWGRLTSLAKRAPLLLLGMMRPVPQRPDLLVLRRVAGESGRFQLTGLTSAAVDGLIAILVGGAPDINLRRLAGGAGGNPLYVTELVAALTRSAMVTVTDKGIATIRSGTVPESLSAAITDRLGFVARPVREVLRAAALLGVRFEVTDLAAVLGRRVVDLIPAVDEARAAGILTDSGGILGFRHPLIRAALYDDMPAPVRTAWHREAGRALAAAGAPPDRVARQILPAVRGLGGTAHTMDAWMLDWLALAADLLIGQAPKVAAELLTLAVGSSPADSPQYYWFATPLADALYRVGDGAQAERVATQALEHDVGPDLLVDLHQILAQCRMRAGSATESQATLERALAAPGLRARHRARLLILAARTHCYLGRVQEAAQVATTALETASDAGDTWAMGWALHVQALVSIERGQMTDALSVLDRALAVAQTGPELADLQMLLQVNKALTLGCLDQYEQAFTVAREVQLLADQVGTIIRLAQVHSVLSQLFFQTGHWDDALAEGAVMPDSLKEPHASCSDLGVAAVISFHRGEIEAGRRYLAAVAPHAERIGHQLIGTLAVARSMDFEQGGARTEALAVLTDAFANATGALAEIEDLFIDAVRLAAEVGDLPTAQDLASRAAALATDSETPHRQANAIYGRGVLDHDASLLLTAAEKYAAASRPLLRAKALEAATEEFMRLGDQSQARTCFDGAMKVYTSLGATADISRMQAKF